MVDVEGWCGRCGQRFRLLEVAEPAAGGSCPRCGEPFAPGYAGVVVADVRRLAAAVALLAETARQLAAVAPSLHVETGRLAAELGEALDH